MLIFPRFALAEPGTLPTDGARDWGRSEAGGIDRIRVSVAFFASPYARPYARPISCFRLTPSPKFFCFFPQASSGIIVRAPHLHQFSITI